MKGGGFVSAYFQSENPFNIQARWIANLPGINQELYQSKDNRDVLADTDDWDNKADKLFSSLPEFDDVDALLRNGVSREAEGRLETWREKNSGFAPNLALVCGLDRRLDWNHIFRISRIPSCTTTAPRARTIWRTWREKRR